MYFETDIRLRKMSSNRAEAGSSCKGRACARSESEVRPAAEPRFRVVRQMDPHAMVIRPLAPCWPDYKARMQQTLPFLFLVGQTNSKCKSSQADYCHKQGSLNTCRLEYFDHSLNGIMTIKVSPHANSSRHRGSTANFSATTSQLPLLLPHYSGFFGGFLLCRTGQSQRVVLGYLDTRMQTHPVSHLGRVDGEEFASNTSLATLTLSWVRTCPQSSDVCNNEPRGLACLQ